MRWEDRQSKLQHVKRLGRLAYRLMAAQNICGVLTIDGEEKHLREYRRGRLSVDFVEPFHANALPTEWSKILVKWDGRRVLVIRFNEAREFETITFEPGNDWERALRQESEANFF